MLTLIAYDRGVFFCSLPFSPSVPGSGVLLQSKDSHPPQSAPTWLMYIRSSCWLHPRYTDLVRLLDAEIMRVTLRPRHGDQRLETVQALMLCAHWMPFDLAAGQQCYQSRFSEAGAWQCLGLAIRWATSLTLERSCHTSFLHPETATQEDARRFRTMLYLVESDH